MQSEIVGALSPSVSEFKPGKTCHKFSGQRNSHKIQWNGKKWHSFSAVECVDRDDWENVLNCDDLCICLILQSSYFYDDDQFIIRIFYDHDHQNIIRIIIITLIIVRAALNSDKSKVICLIIPKGGITHTPSSFQHQQIYKDGITQTATFVQKKSHDWAN